MENKTIKPFEDAGGFTTFRHVILDHIMPACSPNTWKIICAIMRKTIGWGKEKDKISMTQFETITGIKSRPTLITAIQDAIENNYILRIPSGNTFFYQLNREYQTEIGLENKPVQKSNRNTDKRFKNQTEIGLENKLTIEEKKIKFKDINLPNGKVVPPPKPRKSKRLPLNQDHLKPSTPESIAVFNKLTEVQRSKGRGEVKYFANLEQKIELEAAALKLTNAGKFEEALAWSLRNERTSRKAMVNALVTWAANLDKPKPVYQNGNGGNGYHKSTPQERNIAALQQLMQEENLS